MADSDSEDFQSADEFFSEEETEIEENLSTKDVVSTDTRNTNTHDHKLKSDCKIQDLSNNLSVTSGNEPFEKVQTYRKRPEVRQKSVDNDVAKTPELKQIIDVVTVARPDNLLKGITNQITTNISKGLNNQLASSIGKGLKDHFTSNISKGLTAFQENSLMVKEMVLGPDDHIPRDLKFNYNEDRLKAAESEITDTDRKQKSKDVEKKAEQSVPDFEDSRIYLEETQSENLTSVDCSSSNIDNNTLLHSSINEEILKLSEAFTKLNKKQENAVDESKEIIQNLKPFLDEVFVENFVDETISTAVGHVEKIHSMCGDDPVSQRFSPVNKKVTETLNGVSFCGLPHEAEANTPEMHTEECTDRIESYTRKTVNEICIDEEIKHFTTEESKGVHTGVDKVESFNKGDGWGDCAEESKPVEEVTPAQPTEETCDTAEGWGDWGDEVGDEGSEPVASVADNPPLMEITVEAELPVEKTSKKEDEEDGWGNWEEEKDESNEEEPSGEKDGDGWEDFNNDFSPLKKDLRKNSDNDGWGDWGDDDDIITMDDSESTPQMSAITTKQNELSAGLKNAGPDKKPTDEEWKGWNKFGEKRENDWGSWGFSSLLSTATAVTSNISAVTHGISSVIESGLGVPDPETMARIQKTEQENIKGKTPESELPIKEFEREGSFPFSNIVAGVGKFVEVAKVQEIGSRVLSGGLDTLETIGKKTMEVLQEGDPGLKNKRALLVGQGQALSQVLREAKERAAAAELRSDRAAANRRCHLETLFDDFQGLVYLEALEMLSRQCELRLEQIISSLPSSKVPELRNTMEEVRQLCEMDEDFTADDGADFKDVLSETIYPLRNEIAIVKILEVYDKLTSWLEDEEHNASASRSVYEKALSSIAELAAAATQQFHKAGELLILKERRKTVEEADCLLQLSSHVCYEITSISERVGLLFSKSSSAETDMLRRNLAVEADNASAYIKQAFQLLIPVLQLGAT